MPSEAARSRARAYWQEKLDRERAAWKKREKRLKAEVKAMGREGATELGSSLGSLPDIPHGRPGFAVGSVYAGTQSTEALYRPASWTAPWD